MSKKINKANKAAKAVVVAPVVAKVEAPAKVVAKKAAKVETPKVETTVAVPEVSTAWNQGRTMTLHSCMVGGKPYKSVWAAFQALGMGEKSGVSRGQHIRFRRALKALGVGGKLKYRDPREGGKEYEFTLTKPATPA